MDLKRNLSALLSLKNDYLEQVEQEDPKHIETLSLYTELFDDLYQASRRNTFEFIAEVVKNEHFKQCIKALNGNTFFFE